MSRALLATLAVVVSSIMYLPAADSTPGAPVMADADAPPFVACAAAPADSLTTPHADLRKASIEFRISK